jgi:crotonobetainyl-CoA:carnitine CoA-transferase CaiB-like acyl-CoA transferase
MFQRRGPERLDADTTGRNKLAISVDLASPDGVTAACRRATGTDV